jgi:hypothetical protein
MGNLSRKAFQRIEKAVKRVEQMPVGVPQPDPPRNLSRLFYWGTLKDGPLKFQGKQKVYLVLPDQTVIQDPTSSTQTISFPNSPIGSDYIWACCPDQAIGTGMQIAQNTMVQCVWWGGWWIVSDWVGCPIQAQSEG